MDVKIYTTPTCGYCQQAKMFFRQMGVSYQEIDVSRDQTAARQLVDMTGQMGVPVIVMDGEIIVGFDRQRIQEILAGTKTASHTAGPKVRFGLKIADAQRMAANNGGVAVAGVLIGEVAPGALGEKAGLHAGDIITSVNGRAVPGVGDMAQVIESIRPGDIVAIDFQRGGEPHKSEIIA